RVESATRDYGLALLVADTTRAAAGELPGCAWIEVDEVTVKGRAQPVTLYVPLAQPASGDAAEIARFHEQLGLWRLARESLRGHHDDSSPPASMPPACAVATTRLTGLLEARS